MAVCHIVGAGEFFIHTFCPAPGDFVIAADGGYAHLQQYGCPMDLVVGDFDSLGYIPEHPHVIRHPIAKDDTDLALATAAGLTQGYQTFYYYGGLGGRLDHTLANLQLLAHLAKKGRRGYLMDDTVTITAIHNNRLTLRPGLTGKISVFCHGDEAFGVTLEGLAYPLSRARLTGDQPLGVSNEFTGSSARVCVETGTLTILWDGKPSDVEGE